MQRAAVGMQSGWFEGCVCAAATRYCTWTLSSSEWETFPNIGARWLAAGRQRPAPGGVAGAPPIEPRPRPPTLPEPPSRPQPRSDSHRTFFSRVQFYLLHTHTHTLCWLLFAICIIAKRPNYFSAACCCLCFMCVWMERRENGSFVMLATLCALFNLASPLWLVPGANICCVSSCCFDPRGMSCNLETWCQPYGSKYDWQILY